MRIPVNPRSPVQFQLDSGSGGRPDLRAQLTLNRQSGEVVRWEPFESYNAGRRLRSWLRFAHTGEAGAMAGQNAAMITYLGGAGLVWTRISLANRGLLRNLARRSAA